MVRSFSNRNAKPSAPRRRSRRSDDGSVHVLEAVIIATIMISAVVYVTTFDVPPSPTAAPRKMLEQKAKDALAVLYDTPMSSPKGDNALSVYILECLQGVCGNLTTRLDNLLPPGAAYAVYISNGYETFPVYVTREPSGEAITTTQLIEPSWSTTFVSTGTDMVNPLTEPLLVYSLPLFNSNPISQGGSSLRVLVNGIRVSDRSDYILTSHASTYAANSTDNTVPAASLYFANDSKAAIGYFDARSTTLSNDRLSFTKSNVTFRLVLNETQNATVPAGAHLSVQIPRGWTATANESLQGGNWRVLSNATDSSGSYNGSQVVARLLRDVRNESVVFTFNATFLGDDPDYYAFRGYLTRGVQSVAEVLVRANDDNETELAAPTVLMSTPRPMGSGANTTWTMTVLAPVNDTQVRNPVSGAFDINSTSHAIEVRSIEIIEEDGNPIFANVTNITGPGGAWTSRGDRLLWNGTFRLNMDNVLDMTFRVNATGWGGPPPDASPFSVPVAFDEWTGRLHGQSAPGLYRGTVLAADNDYGGYNPDTGRDLEGATHTLVGNASYRTTNIAGQTTYTSHNVTRIADSLYGSYVSVDQRRVPVGGQVVLTSNVQSVLFALAQAGQEAGVTLRFYPPWSGDNREPIYEQTNLDKGLLTGDITSMVVLDMNNDGYPDPVIGTKNGRVIAIHGLTGDRLPGDVWTAPLTEDAARLELTAEVTTMTTMELNGETYIVVGTDENSAGVYVLDRNLVQKWGPSSLVQGSVVSLDATTPIDPADSLPDIVAGVHNNGDAQLYVFRVLAGTPYLQSYSPQGLVDVFYATAGNPEALAGIPQAGPFGASAGVVTTVQTLIDGGANLYVDEGNPANTSAQTVPLSTPRAGLVAINQTGEMTSMLFGTPVTRAKRYDYNSDGITDIVGAGPAGYVIMMNGSVLTQPLYSWLTNGHTYLLDGEARSNVEAYTLSSNGRIAYTDDAWGAAYTTANTVTGAVAIDSNKTNSIWVVGPANMLWRSEVEPSLHVIDNRNYLQSLRMAPLPSIVAKKNNVDFNLDAPRVVNFRDIWMEDKLGWVVGDACSDCGGETVVMRTVNGGDNWTIASLAGGSLVNATGGMVKSSPTKVQFFGGVGWITGENGTLLHTRDGNRWNGLLTGVNTTLRDISCAPGRPDLCAAVGDNATLLLVYNGTTANPTVMRVPVLVTSTDVTAPQGPGALPVSDINITKPFYSIGIVDERRAYIGSSKMVLATFDGARSWTTLPLNYIEHDARAVAVAPDGSGGYIFGGGPSNGRIWLIHDYHISGQAQTTSYSSAFGGTGQITRVKLVASNVTTGTSSVYVDVATSGENWKSLGKLKPPDIKDPLAWLLDGRNHTSEQKHVDFTLGSSGNDFRVRMRLSTPGDRTISTPVVRDLTFEVTVDGLTKQYVSIDFKDPTERDDAATTAKWDTNLGHVRMQPVEEFWTRNVSGEVHDVQIGYDTNGDGRKELWVATGDVLAINSPDYIIYAGTDENRVMHADNRIYVLDGSNGTILRRSDAFEGEVTHLRLADANGDGVTDRLFATTYYVDSDTEVVRGRLYALDPLTLTIEWFTELGAEEARDLEVGRTKNGFATALVATDAASVDSAGHVLNHNATSGESLWRTIPELMGKYHITKVIPPSWLFGVYVVEIEVEWQAAVGKTGTEKVLRTARFYDYFVVTPHDSLSPASPIYNVHLVTWYPDWG